MKSRFKNCAGVMRKIVIKKTDCFFRCVKNHLDHGIIMIQFVTEAWFLLRANSLEEKRELFWKQGDFGYVKDVTDSLVTLCEKKGPLVCAHLLCCGYILFSSRRSRVVLLYVPIIYGFVVPQICSWTCPDLTK